MKLLIVAVLIFGSGLLFDNASGAAAPPAEPVATPAVDVPDNVCAQYADSSSSWASGKDVGWSALLKADGNKAACAGEKDVVRDPQGIKATRKLFYFFHSYQWLNNICL